MTPMTLAMDPAMLEDSGKLRKSRNCVEPEGEREGEREKKRQRETEKITRTNRNHGISGLVVEYIVAIDATWVRSPAAAIPG